MSEHYRILAFIRSIREAHPVMVGIYTEGGCWNLFKTLRLVFPKARAYYSQTEKGGHIVTRIGDKYYDITGQVNSDGYSPFIGIFPKKTTYQVIKHMENHTATLFPINPQ